MKFDATYFSYTNAAYENNYVVSKNVVKKNGNKRSLIARKSYVVFKKNPLSVGTRLEYIFVLPASLYRSLSELAFGNLESGKLRFGPYDTLAHTYRTISLVDRVAFFSAPSARALITLVSFRPPTVYVSVSLVAKIVASCRILATKSLLPAPSLHSQKGNSNA